MKKVDLGHKIFRVIYHYVIFFLLVAFLVTCSMMLFVSVLADTLQLNLTSENVTIAAKLTFGNVILLSVLFTVIDAIRRKLTTEKITEYIANAADKIAIIAKTATSSIKVNPFFFFLDFRFLVFNFNRLSSPLKNNKIMIIS